MVLLVLVREPFSPLSSQAAYRNFMRNYFSLKTFGLTAILPASWLKSIWKNFPEFWSTKNIYTLPPEGKSEFGYFDQKPLPRGPYSYEKGLKDLYDPHKQNPAPAAASQFVYIRRPFRHSSFQPIPVAIRAKASPRNPSPIKASLLTLYYSQAVTATGNDITRSQGDRQETINVIHVRERQEVQEDTSVQEGQVQDALSTVAKLSSSNVKTNPPDMVKYPVDIGSRSLACSLANQN